MAPIFGDLSQSEKLSEIKPPLSITNNLFLFIGKKGQVAIWDVRQHRQLHSFKAHDHPVKCLALDPNEDFFVTESVDGDIKVKIIILKANGAEKVFFFHEPIPSMGNFVKKKVGNRKN